MISDNQIRTEGFLMGWLFTAYSRAFNIDVARAIWDIFLIFGDYCLLQTGISLFNLIKEDLTLKKLEYGFNMMRSITNKVKLSDLVKEILSVNVSNSKFGKIVLKLNLALRNGEDIDMENDPDFNSDIFRVKRLKNLKNINLNLNHMNIGKNLGKLKTMANKFKKEIETKIVEEKEKNKIKK